MIKTHLIWIKLIFFFQSGSLVVLYPYLVIHMRSLGLSVEEVSVVSHLLMHFRLCADISFPLGCIRQWSYTCC